MDTDQILRAIRLLSPSPVLVDEHKVLSDAKKRLTPAGMKRVSNRTLTYGSRHRGQWTRPEYDFDEIQIAQDTSSYIFRSVQKKVNRVIIAGWELVGSNPEAVKYINGRFAEIAWASQVPTDQLFEYTFQDMFRFSNCAWVKARNRHRSSGSVRTTFNDVEIDPVAGYFVLPFETLRFKTKSNGELKKIQQEMPNAETKEFFPRDIVHFYTNRKPGFSVGTPELFPALDDIALLRRIEENVEDLIETNLFPVFHYKVGSDKMPERYSPDGTKETDVVKKTIEYMPAGGVYVSDHRHEIAAIGSEGRALRIDFYLNYFKNRALSALGTSALDMGEGGSANRSTASTLSKGMLMDIEAMTSIVKRFIEFNVISELLLEGGFDPLDQDTMVHIKFGVIDKEERRADENHQIQMWHANVRTIDEVRKSLGDAPWEKEHTERSFYKMFEEPGSLLKSIAPGSAAGETLAGHESSNVSPEAVSKERQFAEKQQKAQAASKAQGRPATKTSSSGSRAQSASRARPSNQHGTRSTTKTNRDIIIEDSEGNEYTVACGIDVSTGTIDEWKAAVYARNEELSGMRVSFRSIVDNLSWRLRG